MPDGSERSTPVSGPLAVTPLYASDPGSGQQVVWWDGASWNGLAVGVAEAPADGTSYARQSGAWTNSPLFSRNAGRFTCIRSTKTLFSPLY